MTDLTISQISSEHEFPLFQNATDFSQMVEQKSADTNHTCLEVILEYCNERMIDDPGTLAEFITKSLKNKLEENYKQLNYLPKTATLDL